MKRGTILGGVASLTLAASLVVSVGPSNAGPVDLPPLGTRDASSGSGKGSDSIILTLDESVADPAATARRAVEAALGDQAGIVSVTPITKDTVSVRFGNELTAAQASRIGEQVEQSPGVATAEPATRVTASTTDDTYYDYLWNLIATGTSKYGTKAEAAWDTSTGEGTVVGVIDTGITAHTDLTGSPTAIVGGNVVAGYDFIMDASAAADGDGRDADPTDPGGTCEGVDAGWHGTHVAGVVAALANNGRGVLGVAPDTRVQPLRVLGPCGGDTTDVIPAIRWGAGLPVEGLPANPTPATVLNLSLGSDGSCGTAMQEAIDAAIAKGVAVVVAVGNEAASAGLSSPANCRGVIRVGASTYEGGLAEYSNYGTAATPLTILAPGGSGDSDTDVNDWIVSTYNAGTTSAGAEAYMGMVGTSMAAPHVAGTIALIKARYPYLTVAQVTSVLQGTATSMSAGCATTRCGSGILNAAKAVNNAPAAALSAVKATIAGTPKLGATLTARLTGKPTPATASYTWLRDGLVIRGATGSTYVATVADVGHSIRVRAALSLETGSVQITSGLVSPAPGTFVKVKSPTTNGKYKVGKTLKANAGTVSPKATKVSYRWLRSGKSIKGATKAKYKLKKADRKKKISVQVTVSRQGYKTVSYTTKARKVS